MAYDEVMNKYERVASVVKTFIKGKHVQVVLGATIEVNDVYVGELLAALKLENRVRVIQQAEALRLEEAVGFDY